MIGISLLYIVLLGIGEYNIVKYCTINLQSLEEAEYKPMKSRPTFTRIIIYCNFHTPEM
jgi:hypothetical protein